MPLWAPLIRAALHSTALRLAARTSRCPPQWDNFRLKQRSYTTALAERPHDDTVQYDPRAQRTSLWSSHYFDLLMNCYDPAKRPVHRESIGDASPTKPSRKERRRARGPTRAVRKRRRTLPSDPAGRARVVARTTAFRLGRETRLRYASLWSELRVSAVYSSAWSLRYAGIVRQYDKELPEYGTQPEKLAISDDALKWTKEVMDRLDTTTTFSLTDIARKYNKLERELWSEVALYFLRYHRRKLIRFLSATNVPLYPPINWVEDCLQALAQHYSSYSSGTTQEQRAVAHQCFRKLIETFISLTDRETKEQLVFAGSFVRQILPYCTEKEVDEVWAVIKLQKVKVFGHTLLHFADYFGKRNQMERSLDALLEARTSGINVDSVAFRSGCSTLLRRSSARPDGLRVCMRLIEHLVSIGLGLSTRIYNILILNAAEAGDLETAHNLYRSMREQAFPPDAYTCAIRLKACKLDIDNVELLGSVIQDAITFGEARGDPVVSNEILHCLALHHAKHNPKTAFNTLVAASAQFYDLSSLKRLGLRMPPLSPPAHQSLTDEEDLPPASTWSIGYLLWIYLSRNANAKETLDLYNRWRELVEAGDEALTPCAGTPHISNLFLNWFTRSKNTLLQAAQVVKDMQRPLPESAGVKQAEPDVYTWSIFAHGFARHGEMKLAEQVLTYMRNKGIQPNHVTWTSLIGSYAAAQDAEGLMDTIRRAERGGDVWDTWTHASIDRFRDKRKLKQLLERQRYERSLDFSNELKDDLSKRLVESPVNPSESLSTTTEGREDGSMVQRHDEGFADRPADLANTTPVPEVARYE